MNLVAKLGYGMMCFCDYDFLDVDCNFVEVLILSFKSCESLLFLKPLSERLHVCFA